MGEKWTDERLDDFRDDINRRFDDVDTRFDKVDKRFDKVEAEIGGLRSEMNARFDGLQRTMIFAGVTIVAALLAILATQL